MAYDGNGTYVPIVPPDFPAVAGSTIRSSQYNNQINDIVAALGNVICKDGQTTITANLPMAGFRHTGVGAASARDQYARAAEVQDSVYTHLTGVSGTNTITADAELSMLAYAVGQRFTFIAAGTNTGAVTININSIGAASIFHLDGSELSSGDIPAGSAVDIVYTGEAFQLFTDISALTDGLAGKVAQTGATGSAVIPAGTTAQRDGSPVFGYTRANSSLTRMEWWNGSGWAAMGGGAVGGGPDAIFFENDITVTTDYTITTGKNAMSAGPITIDTGITVTVPSGSTWTVV